MTRGPPLSASAGERRAARRWRAGWAERLSGLGGSGGCSGLLLLVWAGGAVAASWAVKRSGLLGGLGGCGGLLGWRC
jgi:hypothetical protein